MAERRMFAKTIIDSDAFMNMPLSAQALYFHLSMRADDEGFINNPKKIQRMVGAADDDMNVLILRRFILPFDSGVVVIKHWRIHNYIRGDRLKPTVYTEEKAQIECKNNGAYTEIHTADNQVTDKCQAVGIPSDNQMSTNCQAVGRPRLGKYSIGKYSVVVDLLTEEEYSELCELIGKSDCDYYIERVKAFKEKAPEATFNVKATILKWHREDMVGNDKSKQTEDKPEKSYTSDQLNAMFDNLDYEDL